MTTQAITIHALTIKASVPERMVLDPGGRPIGLPVGAFGEPCRRAFLGEARFRRPSPKLTSARALRCRLWHGASRSGTLRPGTALTDARLGMALPHTSEAVPCRDMPCNKRQRKARALDSLGEAQQHRASPQDGASTGLANSTKLQTNGSHAGPARHGTARHGTARHSTARATFRAFLPPLAPSPPLLPPTERLVAFARCALLF